MTPLMLFITGSPLDSADWVESFRAPSQPAPPVTRPPQSIRRGDTPLPTRPPAPPSMIDGPPR